MGRVVMSRFTQAVIKSRPLKRVGAEQVCRPIKSLVKLLISKILLDVQAVKACLLDLPEPHPEDGSNTYVYLPTIELMERYTKYVTKNTGQLETMLKVILAPDVC